MKTGIERLCAVCLAVSLTACQKPPAEAPQADESSAPPPVAAISATPPPVAATPEPDPLAPPGVFFLLQKLSLVTDDGVVGLPPGTLVKEVAPGKFEANGRPLEVRPSQMTNNLRIARQFASADAQAQAALRAASAVAPKPAAGTSSAAPTAPTPAPPAAAPPAPARPVAQSGSSLSGGSRLGAGTGSADPEYGNRKTIRVDKDGRYYWRDSRGNIRYDF